MPQFGRVKLNETNTYHIYIYPTYVTIVKELDIGLVTLRARRTGSKNGQKY